MKIRTLLLALLISTSLTAQHLQSPLHQVWEKSLPFLANYTTDDYKADLQNWGITQSKTGVIYSANNAGVLEYDATRWRLIKTPLGHAVRSLTKDRAGKIYVGGTNEIGFLAPDSQNQMVFHSLKEKLESRFQNFGSAWFTYFVNDAIYFVCDQYILKWSNNKFSVWNGRIGMLGFAWAINDVLYVDVSGQGLMKMQNDSLVPVEGSALFKGMGLTGLLPYGDHQFLCIGSSHEFYIYNGKHLAPFLNNGKKVKLPDINYHGARLSNGDYALGTTGSGFYLMDSKGNLKTRISRQEGLTSDAVYAVYEDREGDVWLATDNGISRLEVNSPMRVLNEKNGLDETPFDIECFNDKIYATNSKGLFQLNELPSGLVSKYVFRKIKGIDNLTLYCQKVGDNLMVSNYDGIFLLDKNKTVTMVIKDNVARVEETRSPFPPQHLLFGTEGYGVGELRYFNGQWKVGKKRINIPGDAESFSRGANGHIFVNTKRNGIYEIAWKDAEKANSLEDPHTIIHHHKTNGLASNNIKSLERLGRQLFASTDSGMRRFDEQQNAFVRDASFDAATNAYKGSWINEIVERNDGKFWLTLYHNYQSHIFQGGDGKISQLPVSGRFSDALISKVYDTGQGITLFGSNKWIVLYDENRPADHRNIYKTLIRRVTIHKDSLVAFRDNAAADIHYESRDMRFEFSLPSFDLSSKNQYQYFLEGFNEGWSAWSEEAFADFTNLPEGNYTFHVRGKNVYGQVSAEDRYTFKIAPPWHRTWWAYGIYVLLLGGAAGMIIKWRERTLRMEKAILEAAVLERTEKILVQTEELKEMDKMKSRFFANISHEFRTPLTLILGPLEEELNKKPPAEREQLQVMKRYANRLLELVNQLLNLSKLEAGRMDLRVEKGDLKQFLSVISSSFDSLAQQKNIAFTRHVDIAAGYCWYDADKLEKILTNLLSNAFKFTPVGGKVALLAKIIEHEGIKILGIDLMDTGKGIALEEQEQVFQSFYQTRQTVDSHEGGTGLGLALVKELVKLHKGTVSLTSAIGEGTLFTVEIPVDQKAFTAEEILKETRPTPAFTLPESIAASVQDDTSQNKSKITVEPDFRDSVLVVEDNPELRHYMSSLLEKEYVVFSASDGVEAQEKAFSMMPSLVLSDLMMPRMDGMELTEALKTDERTSHIPVILLTAKNEQQSRIDGFKNGADDYLTKPFSTEELLIRVKNLIVMRKKLAERFRERILVPITPSEELSLDDKFLHKVKNVVESNLSDDHFSVEKMAEELNLSRTQLLRKLKALTRLSPTDFIRDMRLKKAAEMIRQKADTITQIGYAVGFSDQSYFTKCFKKQFGVTPTEYAQGVQDT